MKTFENIFVAKKKPSGTLESQISFENLIFEMVFVKHPRVSIYVHVGLKFRSSTLTPTHLLTILQTMATKLLLLCALVIHQVYSQTLCSGDIDSIGDGKCNSKNNNEECDYDGGDCCMCSCIQGVEDCSSNAFDCLDPTDQEMDELYSCGVSPENVPCSESIQTSWVIKDSTDADELIEAVGCSGGVFDVTWEGFISVGRPIRIVGGTILTITGAGDSPTIDGGNHTQLFTTIDSTIHLGNIHVSNGYGITGGGIASRGSSLYLEDVRFSENIASYGGAISMSTSSSASFTGVSTFSRNNASEYGGGIVMYTNSRVIWENDMEFSENYAGNIGGGIYMAESELSSNGNAFFSNNYANLGGAIVVVIQSQSTWNDCQFVGNSAPVASAFLLSHGSNSSFTGSTLFEGNTGERVGSLYVQENSSASFYEDATFKGNFLESGGTGAGIYMQINSTCTFEGETIFENNTISIADYVSSSFGGAMEIRDSVCNFNGNTTFERNGGVEEGVLRGIFSGQMIGGAMNIYGSEVYFSNESLFLSNTATFGGGAISVSSSSMEWTGSVLFSNNSVYGLGGSIFSSNSDLIWFGENTVFENSRAYDESNPAKAGGGAIVLHGSDARWRGNTSFIGCNTTGSGGAILMFDSDYQFFSADPVTFLFSENSALIEGGAIHINNGSGGSFSAEIGGTYFISNTAGSNGGAIGGFGIQEDQDLIGTSVAGLHGNVSFVNNSCGGNGGAIILLDGLEVNLPGGYYVEDVLSFTSNSAGLYGGAIYMSGQDHGGSEFYEIEFTSNVAQIGGAMYISGSGNKYVQADQEDSPVRITNCTFTSNEAFVSGGAIESSAGKDVITESVFKSNVAPAGGSVRLAGTSIMTGCVFEDNISLEGNGPAVSNIGSLVSGNNTFTGNIFDCKEGEFLEYVSMTDEDLLETACLGCGECASCEIYGEGDPVCSPVLDHSKGMGGVHTVKDLEIEEGFWRVDSSSINIFECHNDACMGGLTGSEDYCDTGYEGPYCSVCSSGYSQGLGSSCQECSDSTEKVVFVIASCLTMLFLVLVIQFLLSGKDDHSATGIYSSIRRHIPFQSIKIVIVVWQIITQFSFVANVVYPGVYQDFLNGVDFFNFDLTWVTGCVFQIDFHDKLLVSTIGPLVILVCLSLTYCLGLTVHKNKQVSRELVKKNHLSAMLFLTFIVYSSVSSVLFQTFACEDFEDGSNYLRADYRIECDSEKHGEMQIYAWVMICLYTIGIPVWYTYLMFNRDMKSSSAKSLWESYKGDRFYYEIIECARRVLLTGVVVFIYPNTAAQVAVTLMIAFVFFGISESLSPYSSKWDKWVNRMGHIIVYTSMYIALLLKVDVSGERDESQKLFEILMVVLNCIMIIAIIVETFFIGCSMRKVKEELPNPVRCIGGDIES